MSVFSGSPLRRLWFAPQTTFGTVPNTTGTYTSTGAKVAPYTKAEIKRLINLISAANVKTGTASSLADIVGRACASGSFSNPAMPSGAAGTVPGLSLLLKNIFGVETINASTSVVYSLADSGVAPFIAGLWSQSDSACTHQFAHGGYVKSYTMNLGGSDLLAVDTEVDFFYDLESDNWANEDTVGKGGLTGFPAEPGSPAITGNFVPSYLPSSISIGGNTPVEFVSGQISGNTGRSLRMDGGKYPTAYTQGKRLIALKSLKMADSNASALAAIKNLAGSKAVGDVTIVQGTGVAGYIITHVLKSVQIGNFTFSENGNSLDLTFDDSNAHASALTAKDDHVITFT